jgi:Flp pilus assembly protein TadD
LSRVLSSSGRDADAERTLQETLQVWPDSALAHWWLGSIYDRTNRLADAHREFTLAAPSAVAGRAQFFTKIGQLATTAADIRAAVDAFERSVLENLNDPEAHKRLAGAFMLQDLTDEVFVELVAALLIDPRDAGAYTGIGQVHVNAGRYDEAVPPLRRALELSPNHTEARYALATALMRLGNTQEAAREFERVKQSQRQELEERRRTMSREVLEEEAKAKAR